MRLFRRREGRERAGMDEMTEEAGRSLEQASRDLEIQRRALRRERETVGRAYDQLLEDGHLAELVRRAFREGGHHA